MALTPGPSTFSLDRLRRTWRKGQPSQRQFHYDEYQHFSNISNTELANPKAATRFCQALFSSVQDPSDHILQLDTSFESFFLQPFPETKVTEAAVSPNFQMHMDVPYAGNVDLIRLNTDAAFNARYWKGPTACFLSCQLLQ